MELEGRKITKTMIVEIPSQVVGVEEVGKVWERRNSSTSQVKT